MKVKASHQELIILLACHCRASSIIIKALRVIEDVTAIKGDSLHGE